MAPVLEIESYVNESFTPVTLDGLVKLGAGASLQAVRFSGPAIIGDHSVLRRVSLGAYTGMGAGCHLIDVEIGPFGSFGDYCLINAGRHPTDWLGSGMFQFTQNLWGWRAEMRGFESRDGAFRWRDPMRVGADVWIGSQSTIATGAEIGHGAIIGAHTLIRERVDPYAIHVGSPSRVLRSRFEAALVERLLASAWWELPVAQLSGLRFDDPEAALAEIEKIRAAAPCSGDG